MNITAVYFSPTGNTKKGVYAIAEALQKYNSNFKNSTVEYIDITLPTQRAFPLQFHKNNLVIVGFPVYAGRIPNLLLEYINTLRGDETFCIPVVTFGNRAFDSALLELSELLERQNFTVVAAAALVGLHSFSETLGSGRSHAQDLFEIALWASEIKMQPLSSSIPGEPVATRGYFQPLTPKGAPIHLLKVKPITTTDCTQCGICVQKCPLGSISLNNPTLVVGKCMKCNGCVKGCPQQAKHFNDMGYIIHKEDLELTEALPKENYFVR